MGHFRHLCTVSHTMHATKIHNWPLLFLSLSLLICYVQANKLPQSILIPVSRSNVFEESFNQVSSDVSLAGVMSWWSNCCRSWKSSPKTFAANSLSGFREKRRQGPVMQVGSGFSYFPIKCSTPCTVCWSLLVAVTIHFKSVPTPASILTTSTTSNL